MAKASKDSASQSESAPGYEGRFEQLEGYTVAFESYTEDSDMSSLFKGLPDDACQAPHWGTVLKGKLTYKYTDGTEDTITSGEAYYARPGHTPVLYAGTEVIEFSPTDELNKTMEVVLKNVAEMGG